MRGGSKEIREPKTVGLLATCDVAGRSSEECELWKQTCDQIDQNVWDLDRREEVTMAKGIHTDYVSICLTWHEDFLFWKSSFIRHLT